MKNETALVVDDEPNDRASITRVVQMQFSTVLAAEDYRSAMEIFRKNSDAITFLAADISLPGGNGCDLALEMHKLKPELRVLFISGHVGAQVCRFYGLEVTDVHFLKKPFSDAQLLRAIIKSISSELAFPERYVLPSSGL